MPLPWIKMWIEALDDPKLLRLTLAERAAWWSLLQLAGKCDGEGKLVIGKAAMEIEEIADALHCKPGEDRKALDSMIEKMESRGSLAWNGQHILTITHWEERQWVPPSSTREAQAQRKRDQRERKKKGIKPGDDDPNKYIRGKYGGMVNR